MQENGTPAEQSLSCKMKRIKMPYCNMLSNISETLVFFIAQNRPHGVKTVSRNISCARRKKQGYRIKMKYLEFEDIYREGLRTIKCEKN